MVRKVNFVMCILPSLKKKKKKKLRGHENPGVREFIKEAMESPPEAK